jgi:hypothetical protein
MSTTTAFDAAAAALAALAATPTAAEETDISANEWTNGKDILRFEVGPHTTITVKDCANGLIKCLNSHWLVTHERISQAELDALRQYMRTRWGAI